MSLDAGVASLLVCLTCLPAQGGGPRKLEWKKLEWKKLEWKKLAAEPAWFRAPPQEDGVYRFAVVRRSNLRHLARGRAQGLATRDATEHFFERLVPVVGEKTATKIAVEAAASIRALRGAEMFELLLDEKGKQKMVPGNTLATAWVLFEVPVGKVLDGLERTTRKRVERVLARPARPWRDTDKVPEWVAKPPEKRGWIAIALRHEGEWQRDARRLAARSASADLRREIMRRIGEAVPGRIAARAAAAGVRSAVVASRAMRFRRVVKRRKGGPRYHSTAWVLWEIPVERVLAAVPEASREVVGSALRGR